MLRSFGHNLHPNYKEKIAARLRIFQLISKGVSSFYIFKLSEKITKLLEIIQSTLRPTRLLRVLREYNRLQNIDVLYMCTVMNLWILSLNM